MQMQTYVTIIRNVLQISRKNYRKQWINNLITSFSASSYVACAE